MTLARRYRHGRSCVGLAARRAAGRLALLLVGTAFGVLLSAGVIGATGRWGLVAPLAAVGGGLLGTSALLVGCQLVRLRRA